MKSSKRVDVSVRRRDVLKMEFKLDPTSCLSIIITYPWIDPRAGRDTLRQSGQCQSRGTSWAWSAHWRPRERSSGPWLRGGGGGERPSATSVSVRFFALWHCCRRRAARELSSTAFPNQANTSVRRGREGTCRLLLAASKESQHSRANANLLTMYLFYSFSVSESGCLFFGESRLSPPINWHFSECESHYGSMIASRPCQRRSFAAASKWLMTNASLVFSSWRSRHFDSSIDDIIKGSEQPISRLDWTQARPSIDHC